jgi:hypothetical protein
MDQMFGGSKFADTCVHFNGSNVSLNLDTEAFFT